MMIFRPESGDNATDTPPLPRNFRKNKGGVSVALSPDGRFGHIQVAIGHKR